MLGRHMTLRQLNHMPVVREYQHLALTSEISQRLQNGAGAILVGRHQNVVEDDRQVDAGGAPKIQSCQA